MVMVMYFFWIFYLISNRNCLTNLTWNNNLISRKFYGLRESSCNWSKKSLSDRKTTWCSERTRPAAYVRSKTSIWSNRILRACPKNRLTLMRPRCQQEWTTVSRCLIWPWNKRRLLLLPLRWLTGNLARPWRKQARWSSKSCLPRFPR